MVSRSDHTRHYPDIVEQIAGLGHDIDGNPPPPRAGSSSVSGPPQSGWLTVLRQTAGIIFKPGETLGYAARPRRESCTPHESAPTQYGVQGGKVAAAALQVTGAGAVGDLIALAAEIATTMLLADVLIDDLPSDPYVAVGRVLEEAVRLQAQDGPLALVVDDADKLDIPDSGTVPVGTAPPRRHERLRRGPRSRQRTSTRSTRWRCSRQRPLAARVEDIRAAIGRHRPDRGRARPRRRRAPPAAPGRSCRPGLDGWTKVWRTWGAPRAPSCSAAGGGPRHRTPGTGSGCRCTPGSSGCVRRRAGRRVLAREGDPRDRRAGGAAVHGRGAGGRPRRRRRRSDRLDRPPPSPSAEAASLLEEGGFVTGKKVSSRRSCGATGSGRRWWRGCCGRRCSRGRTARSWRSATPTPWPACTAGRR